MLREADRWFLWLPVLFASGIAVYFSLLNEPDSMTIVALLTGSTGLLLLARGRALGWPLALALCVAVLGFANSWVRVSLLDTATLTRSTSAVTVKGWILHTEPRGEKNHRLVLRVAGMDGQRSLPPLERIRITSRFPAPPVAGSAVMLRAVLRPPPRPVMPGGFDFARSAWFSGIGAVGFAIQAPQPWEQAPETGFAHNVMVAIARLREHVDTRIHEALPGGSGAIASALLTGQRGRIDEGELDALRHSGLAHLLAISGLHMALIAGSLFWLLRAVLATSPAIALGFPVKKIAAIAALTGGGFYLALSGAGIATQRAFLMMGIMFLAVLLDRPAITLRNVAIAALIVLFFLPECLFNVSFQMSFAAAAGLVAFYERWSERQAKKAAYQQNQPGLLPLVGNKALAYLTGIALTTLVASIAVAPFAAFHFHKLAQYSLLANLAAMPIFGLLIMPMALASLLAIPFGLESWPLQAMAYGISLVIGIAQAVSGWQGAVVRVQEMPSISLAFLALGGLWLIIWRTRWRFAGLVVAAAGVSLASGVERPDVLIGRDGNLVAIRGETGELGVQMERGGTYSLEHWLAADADYRSVQEIRRKSVFRCDDIACAGSVRGKSIAILLHPAAIDEECASADIVIARFPLGRQRSRCPGARVNFDRNDLGRDGAIALYLGGQSIRSVTVAERRGNRPWTRGSKQNSRPTQIAEEESGGTARAAGREKVVE